MKFDVIGMKALDKKTNETVKIRGYFKVKDMELVNRLGCSVVCIVEKENGSLDEYPITDLILEKFKL